MLNRENSVLVIIDIQERLVLASKYGVEVSANMSKLAKAADILNIPTIVTEQYPAGLGSTTPELKNSLPLNSFTTEKSSFSAMLEPAFAEKIKKQEKHK
jgi:nicotinamidase-related amidase